jgi:hypothetical protein
MPARAELTLASLGLIHHCSAESLRELATARGVAPDESWNVYALAKALIEPGAVWHQLLRLDRDSLLHIDQLRRGISGSESSLPWGVVDTASGSLRPEVSHAIETFAAEWNTALSTPPTASHTANSSTMDSPAGDLSRSLPGVIDVLDQLSLAITLVASHDITQRTPSGVTLAKALAQLAPDVSATWSEAVDWGMWSGLLIHHGGSWWVSNAAVDFVASDYATKLATLQTLWWESGDVALRDELKRVVTGSLVSGSLAEHTQARFPLCDYSTLSDFFERGHKLGALIGNQATMLVSHLIAGDDLVSVLEPVMPPSAPGVYLDSVDSVVGAGPLTTEHGELLGLVARCVRGGMTPRWVIDRDRVLASLLTTSAEHLCDRLDAVIIGGVPDTLRHQIVDWESRAKALTLSSDFPGTLLHCGDDYLSELLLVDQKLQTLHLVRIDHNTLSSQRDGRQTRQVLLDAGYPTFPADAPPPPPRVLTLPAMTHLPDSWWGKIIADAKDMPKNAVWTEDVLHDAIAERTLLALSVRIGEAERHMVVEPQSIANGRLRVKDTAADVERTLPLDTIVSINPAKPSPSNSA